MFIQVSLANANVLFIILYKFALSTSSISVCNGYINAFIFKINVFIFKFHADGTVSNQDCQRRDTM